MRMNTTIERVFRHIAPELYREVFLHYIYWMDEAGKVTKTKLDKMTPGQLYKEARDEKEHSLYGEALWKNPEDTFPRRLLAIDPNLPVKISQ